MLDEVVINPLVYTAEGLEGDATPIAEHWKQASFQELPPPKRDGVTFWPLATTICGQLGKSALSFMERLKHVAKAADCAVKKEWWMAYLTATCHKWDWELSANWVRTASLQHPTALRDHPLFNPEEVDPDSLLPDLFM